MNEKNVWKSFAIGLQRLWSVFGLALLVLITLEAGVNLLLYANAKYNFRHINKDPHEFADGYKNAPWAHGVWAEEAVLQAKWQPYVYYRTEPFQGNYVRINSDGLRNTVNANDPSQKKIKIFLFGGSAMFGPGVRDEYTIPSCLARRLAHESHRNVEVVNFGQNGYVSTQELFSFLTETQAHNRPDIVIFYDGANEPYAALVNAKAGLSPFENARLKEFDLLGRFKKKALAENFISANIHNSALYGLAGRFHLLFHFHHAEAPPSSVAGSNKLAEAVASVYAFNISMADELSRKQKISSLFYLQPLLNTKKQRTPYEERVLKEWRQGCNCEQNGSDFFLQSYDRIRASRALSSLKNFHDISRLLDHYTGPLYTDGVHLTETGNEIVAKRIAKDVLPILKRLN